MIMVIINNYVLCAKVFSKEIEGHNWAQKRGRKRVLLQLLRLLHPHEKWRLLFGALLFLDGRLPFFLKNLQKMGSKIRNTGWKHGKAIKSLTIHPLLHCISNKSSLLAILRSTICLQPLNCKRGYLPQVCQNCTASFKTECRFQITSSHLYESF